MSIFKIHMHVQYHAILFTFHHIKFSCTSSNISRHLISSPYLLQLSKIILPYVYKIFTKFLDLLIGIFVKHTARYIPLYIQNVIMLISSVLLSRFNKIHCTALPDSGLIHLYTFWQEQ